jgi:hypothetical protein
MATGRRGYFEAEKKNTGPVMEFSKVSEQNAWEAVESTTLRVRRGDLEDQALVDWFRSQGVDLETSVFPCIGLFDDGIYSGTLVNQERRVIEYFVDLECPEDGDFEDVTEQLGPKEPRHPEADIKDLITMSLVYYDDQIGKAA